MLVSSGLHHLHPPPRESGSCSFLLLLCFCFRMLCRPPPTSRVNNADQKDKHGARFLVLFSTTHADDPNDGRRAVMLVSSSFLPCTTMTKATRDEPCLLCCYPQAAQWGDEQLVSSSSFLSPIPTSSVTCTHNENDAHFSPSSFPPSLHPSDDE